MSGGGVSAPQINWSPSGLQSMGFVGGYSTPGNPGGIYNLRETPQLREARTSLSSTFGQEAQAFQQQLNTVQPGYSQFRQAGLANIENARQSTVSNLSDSLSQRRVLGSSFANASISNANADFAQKSSDFIAQSYLQELDTSNKLIQQQFQSQSLQYKTNLDEFNLEGAMAAQLATSAQNAFASIKETQAQLDLNASEFNAQMKASEIAGLGSGIGSLLGGMGGKSDILLKENIRQIGITKYNLPLYWFNFRGSDETYEGVMAHDVSKVMPDAVYRSFDGYHRVDYPKLGIAMRRIRHA